MTASVSGRLPPDALRGGLARGQPPTEPIQRRRVGQGPPPVPGIPRYVVPPWRPISWGRAPVVSPPVGEATGACQPVQGATQRGAARYGTCAFEGCYLGFPGGLAIGRARGPALRDGADCRQGLQTTLGASAGLLVRLLHRPPSYTLRVHFSPTPAAAALTDTLLAPQNSFLRENKKMNPRLPQAQTAWRAAAGHGTGGRPAALRSLAAGSRRVR